VSLSTENKSLKILLGITYLGLLIFLLFFAPFRTNTATTVNFIPFKSIAPLTVYTFTTGHGILHWLINVPGNIIAFIPLPFIFQLVRKSKPKFLIMIFISLIIPFIIEFSQYLFQTGSCDIDDWMLNFAGMIFGYKLIRKFQRQPAS